jgi:hypothetical protein
VLPELGSDTTKVGRRRLPTERGMVAKTGSRPQTAHLQGNFTLFLYGQAAETRLQ